MDVILHVGAHRTATSGFQDYLRRHTADLEAEGVGFWGPRRTRQALFFGVMRPAEEDHRTPICPREARTRIRRSLDQADSRGLRRLLVSDAGICGTVRQNIRTGTLYPDIGKRVSRYARAFDGRIGMVLFSPRDLDLFWCSSLASGVVGGQPVPDRDRLRRIALSPRGWRSVITDLAAALPGVPIRVLPFERFVGRPHALLAAGADLDAPCDSQRAHLNPAPTLPALRRVLNDRGASPSALPFGMGRWNPFTNEEHAALRELHADDMMWLTAGADGLATLTEDGSRTRAGQTPPPGAQGKGLRDEPEERHMARPG